MSNVPAAQLRETERFWARKATLLRLLNEVRASADCRFTAYMRPESVGSPASRRPSPMGSAAGEEGVAGYLMGAAATTGKSDCGLALFFYDDRVLSVTPPFPIGAESFSRGAETGQLTEMLEREMLVGVVLLRLGRYAVGVLRGDDLVASKTDSRYVKSRHRAGGSSQRRFERSRERLVRELFDKTCQVAGEVFGPFEGRIEHVLMGGERQTLIGFAKRCKLLQTLAPITLQRRLDVDRPGMAALKRIHHEVWKSRVVVLAPQDASAGAPA